MPLKPAMRPETSWELLVRSLKLYWQVLPRTIFFALLIAIIVFIPRLLCVAVGQNVFLETGHAWQIFILYVAMYISSLWFLAGMLWCINCIERKRHKSFIVDLEMTGKRMLYVFGAAFCLCLLSIAIGVLAYLSHALLWKLNLYSYKGQLTGVLLFFVLFLQLGLLALIITLFYFYFPLIVLEHEGILFALKTSVLLVWGRIGVTLCLQLTPWLFYFISLLVIKMLFQVNIHIYFMPDDPVANFYPSMLHILVLALFIPWACSLLLVQLRDLKLRKAAVLPKK